MRYLTLILASLLTATCVFAEIPNGDVNCDNTVDIDDVVYTIQYIFASGPPPCSVPPPAGIMVVSGDGQTGVYLELLDSAFVIQALDSNSFPLENVPIVWNIVQGDGRIHNYTPVTDSLGYSTATYLLGMSTGTEVIRSSIFGAESLSVDFSATAEGPDYALYFDGNRRRTTIPDRSSFDLSGGFTIEMWVFIIGISSPSTTTLIAQSGVSDFVFKIHFQTPFLRAYVNSGESTAHWGWTPIIGEWMHIAFSYDSTGGVLYVDGQPRASCGYGSAVENSVNPIILGDKVANDEALWGSLDEVRMWNRALSQTEIESSMNSSLTGQELNLVMYFNFNQFESQFLIDKSIGLVGGYLGSGPTEDTHDPEFIESDAPVTP